MFKHDTFDITGEFTESDTADATGASDIIIIIGLDIAVTDDAIKSLKLGGQ